jgi:hypothetical protein
MANQLIDTPFCVLATTLVYNLDTLLKPTQHHLAIFLCTAQHDPRWWFAPAGDSGSGCNRASSPGGSGQGHGVPGQGGVHGRKLTGHSHGAAAGACARGEAKARYVVQAYVRMVLQATPGSKWGRTWIVQYDTAVTPCQPVTVCYAAHWHVNTGAAVMRFALPFCAMLCCAVLCRPRMPLSPVWQPCSHSCCWMQRAGSQWQCLPWCHKHSR